MKLKRTPQREVGESSSKRVKGINNNDYFERLLSESGLKLNSPPEKCTTSLETILLTRNLKKNLQNNEEYPRNVSEFFENLKQRCDEPTYLKHYLYPNIVRIAGNSPTEFTLNDCLLKILLNIPVLQNKLTGYIFEKAIDLAADSKCGPWIQMILKCFSNLDNVVDSDKIATNLINLLDVTSEKMVRLEIITAIPDIIGDQAHDNIAKEMSRILSEDHDLIPAILDCLSYLCLSDEQYQKLQQKTVNILMALPKCNHFPNFVKFLLMPGRTNDNAYFEAVLGLRNALGWPTSVAKPQDIASSQILTASAIRTSIVSSKVIANSWLKVVSNCQLNTDHKPIDFIIILILYSTTEEKQKQVENVIKKQVKLNIFDEELLVDAFDKFKPILKDYLRNLISLTNSLLKSRGDVEVQHFASHIYSLMFSKLEDCCQTVVAELLQLGLDSKQCAMNILTILNNVAVENMSLLKPQSVQMLTLLDRMDDMTLSEIRAVMNLVCGLAYSYENSVIRDDIHMIVRKELGSSNPVVKTQGILAGVHAVKYLMASNDDDISVGGDNVSDGSISVLPEGDLQEAAQIIELISCSTRQFPDMIAFFYDELYKIVQSTAHINSHFLSWITDAVTNDLQQNFIVDTLESETLKDLKLDMQFCLNTDSETDEPIAINIGGIMLGEKKDISIQILSPLFQLVQALHTRKHNGNLSSIDALLGCPVVMPIFDLDLLEIMSNTTISHVLDCQVHCVNWFRELLNAFASQNDPALKTKILNRVLNIRKLEKSIEEILLQSNLVYKPPTSTFNLNNSKVYSNEKKKIKVQQNTKSKLQKKAQDVSTLSETLKSQASVRNNNATKNKATKHIQSIPFRSLNLNLINLLKWKLADDKNTEGNLTMEIFIFLLKCINYHLENILLSKIKRNTFLTKKDDTEAYDHKKAHESAKYVSEMLPKIMDHMKFITTYLDEKYFNEIEQEDNDLLFDSDMGNYIYGLENIFNICTTYFKWIGFKNQHKSLLKTSLRAVTSADGGSATYVQDLILSVAKHLQKHEKYCLQLTTALSLFEFLKAIQEYSSSPIMTQIIREQTKKFLSNQWKTPDGVAEKGLFLNQCVDNFARVYFTNNQISELKNLTLLLMNDVQEIAKSRNSTLNTFQSVNKLNFPILYRNLGGAILVATKSHLNKKLTNSEHLDLWKNILLILKCMLEISKTLESRNNLSAFFKKSLPIIKLFISQGIPILGLEFKNKTPEILELLKTLQQITRFLQSLCHHFRLKKDTALINKIPYVRQLLETLIYKVKAVLAANNCSEAFWMGNLKNKDIHGELISTQESEENDGSGDDCDEQLPEDDDSNATDDEMLNPDSRSISDIV